jgi:hypothetical protein
MPLRSVALALALCAGRLAAQEPGAGTAPADSTTATPAATLRHSRSGGPSRAAMDSTARAPAPRRGAELLVPAASLVLPGLGST